MRLSARTQSQAGAKSIRLAADLSGSKRSLLRRAGTDAKHDTATQAVINEILGRRDVVQHLQAELLRWKRNQDIATDVDGLEFLRDGAIPAPRFRSGAHRFAHWLVTSATFQRCVMTLILANALVLAVETSIDAKAHQRLMSTVDLLFTTAYAAEFALKVFCEPVAYWRGGYNRFDFCLLVISVLDAARFRGLNLDSVQILRAMRALRALRSIGLMRALRTLVSALMGTLASVVNVLFLLLLIIYIYAVVGFYLFGDGDPYGEWDTVGRAMMSLAPFVTCDGWTSFSKHLDERGLYAARIFCVSFILLGHFVMTNLFIGIVIQNLEETQTEAKLYSIAVRTALVRAKRGVLLHVQYRDLDKVAAGSPRGGLAQSHGAQQVVQYEDVLKQVRERSRHDDMVPMTHLSCNLVWLKAFLISLNIQETTLYKVQQLHFDIARTLAEQLETRRREAARA